MSDYEALRNDPEMRPLLWQVIAAKDAEVARLRANLARALDALRKLEQWDMLSLTPDGHGAATADAPWARALIADVLAAHGPRKRSHPPRHE